MDSGGYFWIASVWVLASLCFPAAAHGQVDEATALFEAGKKLFAEGKTEQACTRFQQSYDLVPGIGIQYNLARCYAKLGRSASAYRHFLEVADIAQRTGQLKRAGVARDQAAQLEPVLVRVRVRIRDASEGLVVSIDDAPLSQEELSAARPVDPGRHEIVAVAPERVRWSSTIDATKVGDTIEIEVPILEKVEPNIVREEDGGLPSLTVAGIVVGVVGVAGLAASGVLAGLAVSRDADAEAFCAPEGCQPEGIDAGNDAARFADVASVLVVGGGVLAAVGVALVIAGLVSDEETTEAAPVAVVPMADGTGASIVLRF